MHREDFNLSGSDDRFGKFALKYFSYFSIVLNC